MASDRLNGQRNDGDAFLGALVVLIVAFLAAPFVWPVVAPKLTPAITWISQAHLLVFPWLLDDAANSAAVLEEIRRNKRVFTGSGAWSMLNEAARYTFWAATPLFLYWILRSALKPAAHPEWHRVLGKFDLIRHQSRFWPASFVVKDLDLLDPKMAEHPYRRRALTPLEWAMRERVVESIRCVHVGTEGDKTYYDEMAPKGAIGVSRDIPFDRIGTDRLILMFGVLNQERAEAAFASQIGRKFTTYQALPPLYRGLVCFLAVHAGRDRQLELQVQMELIESRGAPGPKCEEAWRRFGELGFIARAAAEHAYESTVLRRLISDAKRLGGKMETWYVWIKAVDFGVYLNLNDDGRLTGWSEVAGIRAQYQAELVLARFNEEQQRMAQPPLSGGKPQMGEAVKALQKFLEQTGVLTGEARLLD